MADEGKKRKVSEIAEDADDSVDKAEAPAQQVEDATEVAQRKADWEAKAAVNRERLGQLEQESAADLVKSAMQTVGAEGMQKLLEQHLAREEAAKKRRAAEEVKAKAMRAEEAKTIAAAAAKAPDEAASKAASGGVTGTPSSDGGHPNAACVGGKEGKVSGMEAAITTQAKVEAELGGPERIGLAREEVFERKLKFHWDCSRIYTPARWCGVDLGYVCDVTRRLTVVGEFDETRDDWGYQTANTAGVERYLLLKQCGRQPS
ncbi:hypothetical protein H257_12970 [Aphanomyces astaci]|uniref:Uncharacterized protein n=1 Tax=Aphanomyces astaci TaxID=112090 RepID=W4FWB9_APHAT|nr:hypothetical protein H257_12970 [Aphanomyces astaci]ETV71830.1 hypothetical protein H257_12970 [Aphanomyces astaci]|eukprot:XP_009838679.1 hypothetical protein H257_12970 [Aphanomyces astaci]